MSDDYADEFFGDTDPNNLPDGDDGQNMSAGDGLPGYPVDGHPDWRAGAFGSGDGLLRMTRVSDLVARPGDGSVATIQFGTDRVPVSGAGDPWLMLASNPQSPGPTAASDGRQAYPMPPAYMPDGHGGVQLRPGFAATHPKGPFDFGAMAHNIDWIGVAKDLATILASSVGAGSGETGAMSAAEIEGELPASVEEGAKIQDYGGPGGGHHVPAKSAFHGAEGYDPASAPAIPNDELTRLGVDHNSVTVAQRMGYRALAQSGNPLTWDAVEQVETNALVRGGMDPRKANVTVQNAIKQLRQSGVSAPARIPWSR